MGDIPQMSTVAADKRCHDESCNRYGIVMMLDRWWCRAHAGLIAFKLSRTN